MSLKSTVKARLKENLALYSLCRRILHPAIVIKDIRALTIKRKLLALDLSRYAIEEPESPHIVISLTSYGERLNTVHLAIRSILRQSVKPDAVVLWVSEEENSVSVPKSLKALADNGVDIRYGCKDIKSHKKYYWALQEFENSCVITIDDDVMYPPDTIESLLAAHEKYPDAVAGRRVHRMTLDDGHLCPYNAWDMQWTGSSEPRFDLLATGVGGVLYPPHCFDAAVFDLRLIAETSMGNDDIWLKAHELLMGRRVVWAPCKMLHPYEIDDSDEHGLCKENVGCGGNDASIKIIERGLGIRFADYAE